MEDYKKIAVLEDEVEAGLVESVLRERDIPHRMTSYYDTALDGLFQVQKGWGYVAAPEEYEAEVMEILADLREGAESGGTA